MLQTKKIRALKAEEVECRVGNVGKGYAQLLLYKDARCDRRILDEVFGIYGWKNRFDVVNDNLFCTISVWDEEHKQWIDKCDCGTESYTAKEKGEASDAFKRAASALGIGRELYTKIYINVKCETEEDGKDKNGKPKYKIKNFEKWDVSQFIVGDKNEKIIGLEIVDKNGITAFTFGELEDKHLKCLRCKKKITVEEHDNSVRRFKTPLCEECQKEATRYFAKQKEAEDENKQK